MSSVEENIRDININRLLEDCQYGDLSRGLFIREV